MFAVQSSQAAAVYRNYGLPDIFSVCFMTFISVFQLQYHTSVPNIPVSFLFVLIFPYRPCDLVISI
jgi:hypothetical protein